MTVLEKMISLFEPLGSRTTRTHAVEPLLSAFEAAQARGEIASGNLRMIGRVPDCSTRLRRRSFAADDRPGPLASDLASDGSFVRKFDATVDAYLLPAAKLATPAPDRPVGRACGRFGVLNHLKRRG